MEPLIKYGYPAVNIYFVGTCNLKCVYCFQPKISDTMNSVNKKIIEWVTSGKMEEDIEKYIGKEIESLSLWGGEPSLNLPYLQKRLPFIRERFPRVKEIFYSTNISTKKLAQNTIDFAKALVDLNRANPDNKIRVHIQISIDGPPEINDVSRIGSSADQILDNVTYVLEELVKVPEEDRCFTLSGKSTMSAETIRWFMEPHSKYDTNLEYHFRYFDEYHFKWNQICNFWPVLGGITLVYPGNYTQEDGKVFAELTKLLSSKEFVTKDWKIKPNLNSQVVERVHKALTVLEHNKLKLHKHELYANCSCSAGRSCAGISYDGKFHWCQSTYFFDEEVNKTIVDKNLSSDFEEKHGFSFRNFDNYIKDVEIVDYENDLLLSRSLNMTERFWTNLSTRTQYLEMMVTELASVGQIDKCFLEPRWRDLAVGYLLFGGNECPSDNVWEHGSIYVRSNSHMKLVFNGAFQEAVKNLPGLSSKQYRKRSPDLT